MRATLKNTTALIAALSMSVPVAVPVHAQSSECHGGSVPVTAGIADEVDLFLSDPLQTALDGGEVPEGLSVVVMGGEPALCLTASDLELLGASESQIAMIMDTQPEEAVAEGHGNATESAAPDHQAAESAHAAQDGEVQAEAAAEGHEGHAAGAAEDGAVKLEAMAESESHDTGATEGGEVKMEAMAEGDGNEMAETGDAEVKMEGMAEGHDGHDAGTMSAEAAGNGEVQMEPMTESQESEAMSAEASGDAASEETVAEAEAPAEAETDAAVEEALAEAAAAIEEQAVEEVDAEAQAEVAEQEAPEESAAATDDAEVAEVEEEVVTEETARSSTEEFESRMETTAGATASGGDEGLSNFEKALIAGLGAIVVGKALGDRNDAQVVSKSQDRVVVLQDGRYRVIRDDNELIERPGSTVRRERFEDGSTRTTVTREDGVRIVTIRDAELRVVRRVRIDPNGVETVLIDDTADVAPVDVAELPELQTFEEITAAEDREALRKALERENLADRRFALYQVRNIERVRKLAPAISLDAINFRSGSSVIDAEEVRELTELGDLIRSYIDDNPGEVFLIEGHTDAVGNAAMNLALSDRRAESVALALTEFFGVPPENLVVQGYGESDLKVRTLAAERANRRAAVRRITPLITASR